MKRTSFGHMRCPIAQTLNHIGEWWTPLILRDLFYGIRRFEDLRRGLGISRRILSDRLKSLLESEIVEQRRYQDKPERYEYRLTERGVDLFPVLVALMRWGNRWMTTESTPVVELVHKDCAHVTKPILVCSHCGEEINAPNVRPVRHRAGSTEEWEALERASSGGLLLATEKVPEPGKH